MPVTVERFDSSRLGAFRRAAGFAAVVPGLTARTGVQVYEDANGKKIREYRPPEEVFAEDSLASYRTAPITIKHPKGGVRAENFQAVTHGICVDVSGRERADGREWVKAEIALMSTAAIGGVESGKLGELSVGYTARIDATPGMTPDGEAYDVVQRDIRVNHIALLPPGHARAGRQARLRLDGSEELIEDGDERGDEMDEKLVEALKQVATLTASLSTEKTRADSAEAKLAAAEDKAKAAEAKATAAEGRADALEAALKPLKEDSAKREAHEIAARAASVLGKEYKVDSKSAHEVRCDAIKGLKVALAEDKLKNETYVQAYFDSRFDESVPVKHDYNQGSGEKQPRMARGDTADFNFSSAFLAKGRPAAKESK